MRTAKNRRLCRVGRGQEELVDPVVLERCQFRAIAPSRGRTCLYPRQAPSYCDQFLLRALADRLRATLQEPKADTASPGATSREVRQPIDGGRDGSVYSKVVQRKDGLRLHPAERRQQGRVR